MTEFLHADLTVSAQERQHYVDSVCRCLRILDDTRSDASLS